MGLLDPAVWSDGVFSVGGWVPGSGGAADVVEPATGDVLGRVGMATHDDVTKAAAAAAQAQRGWAGAAYEERGGVLRRAGRLGLDHAGEIESWIVREAGSIPPKAALETHVASQ